MLTRNDFKLTSPTLLLLLAALFVTGCSTVYYKTYEAFGVHKRDLLKKAVVAARDGQAEAQTQFKDALTRLKEITKFDGGDLEKTYTALKSEHEDCSAKAGTVSKRIREMGSVAEDLFAEWEKELGQIGTPTLRDASKQQLATTRQRYAELDTALKGAEKSMEPVLKQLNDYVLYLKHNLNAQAIASLKGEATSIQNEITRLLEQMNKSITRADEFVKTMK